MKVADDDGNVVVGSDGWRGMATYVIDSNRGLWRIDPDGGEAFSTLPVAHPECPHCGHRETARLRFEEIVVDPTDDELAGLEPKELERFGMRREQLRGSGR